MKRLNIYFDTSEEDLYDWFRKTHDENRGRIIKEHIRNLRENETAKKHTPDELIRQAFAEVQPDEHTWIALKRKAMTVTELKTEIANKAMQLKASHPECGTELNHELKTQFPRLYGMIQ